MSDGYWCAPVTIELRSKAKAPVYAFLTAPSGTRVTLHLRRLSATRWRAPYRFPEGGRWIIRAGGATTHSLVMRGRSGTVRSIVSEHQLMKLKTYASIDFEH